MQSWLSESSPLHSRSLSTPPPISYAPAISPIHAPNAVLSNLADSHASDPRVAIKHMACAVTPPTEPGGHEEVGHAVPAAPAVPLQERA